MQSSTAPNDNIFEEDYYDDSQMDHLVPAAERQEPATRQEGGPEALEDTGDSQNDAAGDIERFRLSCETVEQAARRQAVWDESTVAKLEDYLRGRAIAETPTALHCKIRQEVIERVDNIVRSGLRGYTGMHVEHYGSFTSGLFTPTGDLDIAIEGRLEFEDGYHQGGGDQADLDGLEATELHKDEKAAVLRALVKRLMARGISEGRPQGIFHARVPIVKFVDAKTGIPCDMAVGSGGARFKSTVLLHLSMVDQRFPDLMRIVKLWAKSYSLNDASQGTFNTFALTLMTRSPPVLPPICELFGIGADAVEARPLHKGRPADMALLEMSKQRALQWRTQKGGANEESLLGLLSSFFATYTNASAVWTANRALRAVRCCTWAGQWSFKPWAKVYMMPIEDPFDATDNCARSIFASNAEYVSKCFRESLMATQKLQDPSALPSVIEALFAKKADPYIRHPFAPKGGRQGWNEVGWGRGGRREAGRPGKAEQPQHAQRTERDRFDRLSPRQAATPPGFSQTRQEAMPPGFQRQPPYTSQPLVFGTAKQPPPGVSNYPESYGGQTPREAHSNYASSQMQQRESGKSNDGDYDRGPNQGGSLWEPMFGRTPAIPNHPARGQPGAQQRQDHVQARAPPPHYMAPPPKPPSRSSRDSHGPQSGQEMAHSDSRRDSRWQPRVQAVEASTQAPPGFGGRQPSFRGQQAYEDLPLKNADSDHLKGLFSQAAIRHQYQGPGSREVEVDSLAAQLPASLGLDADTLDASPRRIPRPGVDNYGRRRDVFHRPHQPVKGQSSARVSNPRAKTHFHGESRLWQD